MRYALTTLAAIAIGIAGNGSADAHRPAYHFRFHARLHHRGHSGVGDPAGGIERVFGDPRPSAWCGWAMRQWLHVASTKFNLARAWASYGIDALAAGVGVVVVWPHHVGIITGKSADGRWIVKSGNDGHQVKERPRSVGGAIAFRRPGVLRAECCRA